MRAKLEKELVKRPDGKL